jgi:hypothetical protein
MRKYEVLVCTVCKSKYPVRADAAKNLSDSYICHECSLERTAKQKFFDALGDAAELVKDTFTQNNHRYVLVDCTKCKSEYWARFDNWEEGYTRCWSCTHRSPNRHGKSKTKLFNRWHGMLSRTQRSSDPKRNRTYFDRSITVCEEWRRDFETFERWALLNGFKPNLILDRIDNYKGYSPENCRWVTPKQSTENRRKAIYI